MRKVVERSTDRSVRIATLQPASENRIQGSSRDDSQLAGLCDGPRQSPIRYASSHAALDNDWVKTFMHVFASSLASTKLRRRYGPQDTST